MMWNKTLIGSDLLKLYAAVEFIRHLDGEKHVVSLTSGMFLPIRIRNYPPFLNLRDRDDSARLAARANDAQVAIDIIETSGTKSFGMQPGTGGQGASPGSIMASATISELSGGQFTSVRMADQALARIDEASRMGYILGYTPTNPTLDGKYRNISVKVNRRDVTVLYRHGYTASNTVAPVDLRGIVTSERLHEAGATAFESDDIKVDVKAVVVPKAGTPGQMRVDLKIDASRLSLTRRDANHTGLIDLVILCGDEKQNVVCTLKQQMTLNMDGAHHQLALRDGIPYSTTIPLTGQASLVKVLVYDYAVDLLGAKVLRLR